MTDTEPRFVLRKLDELIFAEYNPRKLTDVQRQQLTDSIKRFDIVDPLIVNMHPGRKNIIIGGHQRAKVAKDLGYKEVPCVEVHLTLDRERELNIRLNQNTGEWDLEALGEYFDPGELVEWGFDPSEVDFAAEIGLPELPSGEKEPFQQMMFTLHDSQVEIVQNAIEVSKSMGSFDNSPNLNSNGNALSRVCEIFLKQSPSSCRGPSADS